MDLDELVNAFFVVDGYHLNWTVIVEQFLLQLHLIVHFLVSQYDRKANRLWFGAGVEVIQKFIEIFYLANEQQM